MSKPKPPPFTRDQKFIIAILAFLQFTLILDFMIMSPLGAMIMPALHITTSQFGLAVSVYAFSAGGSGLLAAGFADRFDRKKLLIFFYTGFLIGTFLCGIANTFEFLIFARILTGLFGGVIGATVLAITTDLFPLEARGRVMGAIQTAFGASQILGIPLGLYITNLWDWHAPFLAIVAVGTAAIFLIVAKIPAINSHLGQHTEKNPFRHLKNTLSNGRYIFAIFSTALISIGGFMLMPFGSAFTVNNLGIAVERLPLIYLVAGVATLFIGPLIGRMTDRVGKFETFVFGSIVSIVTVLIYTNMGITPLHWVIVINVAMFVGIFSRMIPSQALVSAIPDPKSRGAFMSVTGSMQQLAGGLGAMLAGMIVVRQADGHLEHFDILGYVLCGTVTMTVVMLYFISRMTQNPPSTGRR